MSEQKEEEKNLDPNDISLVMEDDKTSNGENINQTKDSPNGLSEEISSEQSGENNKKSAAANPANPADTTNADTTNAVTTNADTTNADTTNADTTNADLAATADNAVYAIIKIDSEKKITVLDAMPDGQNLNTSVSPYDLLANKTESVFAVKIVKKDNCDGATDQIKCISFGNSHYELDLSEKISDTQDNLLNSEFLSDIALLKGAESNNGAAHEVDLSETAVSETAESNNGAGSEVAASDLADTQTSRKFKKGDVVKYNGDTLSITGIGKNKDGKMSYTTTKGSRNGEDVDKTATLVNPNSGGSRKNRGQQSKKTKRKYYVYRK